MTNREVTIVTIVAALIGLAMTLAALIDTLNIQ